MTRAFVSNITRYDPTLGYPFFHVISNNQFSWFSNAITRDFLYHALAKPNSVGSLGVVEAVAQSDGSQITGPLVVFVLEKLAFVLAWVSSLTFCMYNISFFT